MMAAVNRTDRQEESDDFSKEWSICSLYPRNSPSIFIFIILGELFFVGGSLFSSESKRPKWKCKSKKNTEEEEGGMEY